MSDEPKKPDGQRGAFGSRIVVGLVIYAVSFLPVGMGSVVLCDRGYVSFSTRNAVMDRAYAPIIWLLNKSPHVRRILEDNRHPLMCPR